MSKIIIINPSPSKLFVPSDLGSSLALWLDAADLSTITIATGVSQWQDKSGFNRHFSQSTAGRQPQLINNGINNLPVLRALASSQQWLSTNSNISGFSGGPNLWAISVANMQNSSGSFARLISYNQVGRVDYNVADLTSFVIRNQTLNIVGSYRANGFRAASSITYELPFINAQVFNGTSNFSYLNGTLNSTVSSTGNFVSTPRITIFWDNDPSFSSYWSGDCGEIIIGDTILTDRIRQLIEGYLAHKWGLVANLPAAHPFKNRPPLMTD